MTTIRKLCDTDVRIIFECINENRAPPPHLEFKIVPVGSSGQRLSPPALEFEDGLYVLLKPQKKKKKKTANAMDQQKVPSNLMPYVMKESLPAKCRWSLSGPQFPPPTAMQQRYCYPHGNLAYSGRKGGALWTMFNSDGVEDVEFRLLHVYFSAKRAVNKGCMMIGSPGMSLASPPRKRSKRSTPKRTRSRTPSTVYSNDDTASPITHASSSSNRSMTFESNFDALVTPDTYDFGGQFHPVRNNTEDMTFWEQQHSPTAASRPRVIPEDELLDTFHLNMHETSMPDFDAWFDVSKYPTHNELQQIHKMDITGQEDPIRRFAMKLENMHDSIKEFILTSPNEYDQCKLLALVSGWARNVAVQPLGTQDKDVTQI